ncbi:hypothetical protein SDC9_155952 [bioreactor metagenome]|uniref:Uncharacterized protein n=1 Tax=bioreactor metagenome TaxID=1076179 RepID=A0A645F366_9ZZZZ
MIRNTPIIAKRGVKLSGLNSFMKKLSDSIPARLNIHAVTVVPILAPIMTPTDCDSFMMPEFTKPTTITVVAEELCITAVTSIPINTPLIGDEVSFSRIFSRRPPSVFSSAVPIICIPKRKNASPQIRLNTLKRFIAFLSRLVFCTFFTYNHNFTSIL